MVAGISTGALVVFAVIAVALASFVGEWLPPDITAVGVLVALAVLEPYTGVDAATALSGLASPATVTILAMYVLSAGVERSGVVEYLGAVLADATGGDERRLLGATIGTTGIAAGFVNNTPVVAVFIPMVSRLSDRAGISPSKLLMPLSFAAMLGGTLTLVGTATNLLASDLSAELGYHAFSMFELTPVGIVVLAVGLVYLMTVGRRLVPERIPPSSDFTDEYDLDRHLSVLVVREGSPLVGHTVADVLDDGGEFVLGDDGDGIVLAETVADADDESVTERDSGETDHDVDVLQVERDGEAFVASAMQQPLDVGDRLTVRGDLQSVNAFADAYGLGQRSREVVSDETLVQAPHDATLLEAVVHPESRLTGRTVEDLKFRERFDTTVLAVRRGDTVVREDVDAVTLERGDTLLLQTTAASADYFEEAGYLLVTERVVESEETDEAEATITATGPKAEADAEARAERPSLDATAPIAVGVLVGVIALAATGLVQVAIAALGGMVVLVASGTITANQAYDAVNWSVVFLLAGLLPLGVAMRETGGDEVLASVLVASGDLLPVLGFLALVYLLTSVVAAVITPVATVVLLLPVAVEAATELGYNGFPFLIAVTFAAANAFLTPIGYQTNLMVYGPGGYRFTDYARVGAPLQLILAVVTTLSIAAIWPP